MRQAKFHTIVYGETIPEVGSQFDKTDCLIICQLSEGGTEVKLLYADGNGKVVEHTIPKAVKKFTSLDDLNQDTSEGIAILEEDNKTYYGIEGFKTTTTYLRGHGEKSIVGNSVSVWEEQGDDAHKKIIITHTGGIDKIQTFYDGVLYSQVDAKPSESVELKLYLGGETGKNRFFSNNLMSGAVSNKVDETLFKDEPNLSISQNNIHGNEIDLTLKKDLGFCYANLISGYNIKKFNGNYNIILNQDPSAYNKENGFGVHSGDVLIGNYTGFPLVSYGNTIIGNGAGISDNNTKTSSWFNTIIGFQAGAGRRWSKGFNNVIIGAFAQAYPEGRDAYNLDQSNKLIIGSNAHIRAKATGSLKEKAGGEVLKSDIKVEDSEINLVSTTTTGYNSNPLLFGDFKEKWLKIYGKLLLPISENPATTEYDNQKYLVVADKNGKLNFVEKKAYLRDLTHSAQPLTDFIVIEDFEKLSFKKIIENYDGELVYTGEGNVPSFFDTLNGKALKSVILFMKNGSVDEFSKLDGAIFSLLEENKKLHTESHDIADILENIELQKAEIKKVVFEYYNI
ncbi:hypothetical protein EDL98_11440 [Ornithobacterium rhinotracheale]|uniref:hypothetical protein n=1 Tax=Ornithobacterium rhinotracheale TaxID=28251 RepID=UPI00129D15FE|nr:hypothetical protein [Ornithobacterium rhinotracheale]MRJ11675.1 hypothetical protein [Ornithobacterium rhinotracheale]